MAVPLRIIGTTGLSGSQIQPAQVDTGSREISAGALARSTEAVNAAGQSIQQAFSIQQQTAAQLNQSTAQQRGVSSQFSQALDSLAKASQVFGEMFGARQEQQQKMQERLDTELDEQQKVYALQALQPVVENARNIIQQESYERGVPMVREMAIKALSAFENLSPETVQSVMNGVFSDLNRINEDMWNEGQRNIRDAREAARGAALERGKIEITTITARLSERGAYMTDAQTNEEIQRAVGIIQDMEEFQSLSPLNQAQMMGDIYRFIGSAYQAGSEKQQQLFGRAEAFSEGAQKLQSLIVARDNGLISNEQYNFERQEIELLYDLGNKFTPWGQQEELRARLESQQLFQEYHDLQRDEFQQANPLIALEVGKIVASIAQGGSTLDQIQEGTPYRDQVESAYKLYQQNTAELNRIYEETTEANSRQAELLQQMALARRYVELSQTMTPEQLQRVPSEYLQAYNNDNKNQAELRALQQQATANQLRIVELQAPLIPYGLQQGHDRQLEFYNSPQAQRQREEAAAASAQRQAVGRTSFRPGDAALGPAPRPLATLREAADGLEAGVPIPFAPGSSDNLMVVTSGYLAIRGNGRRHAGIDFAPTGGDRGNHQVASVRGGRVTQAACSGGWGCHVLIQDAQGNTAVYAHLTGAPQVKPGDVVAQGQVLGIMGNTGNSRGAHLHFSVLKPGATSEGNGANTLDPMQYIRESRNESAGVLPRGVGLPPGGSVQPVPESAANGGAQPRAATAQSNVVVSNAPPPRGAYILPDNSAYVYGGTIYAMSEEAATMIGTRRQQYQSSFRIQNGSRSAEAAPGPYAPANAPEVFHAANPVRNNRYSNDLQDYGDIRRFNNPDNNYGYEVLAQDAPFRRKLHELANELGIPAVWLVDVMAFETRGTFNPSIPNQIGCHGLIQFCPDSSRGAVKTVNGRQYSMAQLSAMTRTEQLDVVREYFAEHRRLGGNKPYEHAHQVLFTVWGGGGRAWRNPAELRNLGDGYIQFHQYLRRLGEHVGRRYHTPYDQVSSEEVHDSMVAGCPSCQQQGEIDPSQFIAHVGEASLLSMLG